MILGDILISDCSGITLEYAFGTERPVIYIDVPLKIKNKRYQELGIEPLEISLRAKIGEIVSPECLPTLPQVIEQMFENSGRYKSSILAARRDVVFTIGSSSKAGAEYLVRCAMEASS